MDPRQIAEIKTTRQMIYDVEYCHRRHGQTLVQLQSTSAQRLKTAAAVSAFVANIWQKNALNYQPHDGAAPHVNDSQF